VRPDGDCGALDIAGAPAIRVGLASELPRALKHLGLPSRAVLVLVGGAGSMEAPARNSRLRNFFFEVLAPLAESLPAVVIDGGTDAGVMRWMGAARSAIRGTFPLVGVAAIDTINFSGPSETATRTARLEARHSHFLLVPGNRWGDESPWIARTASLLSEGHKSLTVAVNGGDITLRDIAFSIRECRPVCVLSGSGRTADRIAACLNGLTDDPEIHVLISSGLVQALEIDWDDAELTGILRSRLGR
jgi:SLOG in TRPM, prokaryote